MTEFSRRFLLARLRWLAAEPLAKHTRGRSAYLFEMLFTFSTRFTRFVLFLPHREYSLLYQATPKFIRKVTRNISGPGG